MRRGTTGTLMRSGLPRILVASSALATLVLGCSGNDDNQETTRTTTTTPSSVPSSGSTSVSTTAPAPSSTTTTTTATTVTSTTTAPATTSTSTTTTTTTTVAAPGDPGTPPDAAPITGRPTAEQAATALYHAWQAGDPDAASEVAESRAVVALFGRSTTALQFLGCFDDGDVAGCQFSSSQDQLTFRVASDAGRYRVSEVVAASD